MAKRDACGGGLPPDMDKDTLRSMKEICAHTGYADNTIVTLVKEQGFPAAIIAGKWESSRALIAEWRLEQIRLSVSRAKAEIQEA
ncbi:MAG: hypothetical protein AUJ49_05030 [Desulfovibrionaceae bacterium CG1_02_65_16]|nr:MAG: hypothetical protein AUJ49_05030 [Desulfovibrionaceae bacterium CG1_02_65_16]